MWRLERFRGSGADVFGGYSYGLILSCGNKCTSCQVVGFSEETARTLMNGCDGRFIEGAAPVFAPDGE